MDVLPLAWKGKRKFSSMNNNNKKRNSSDGRKDKENVTHTQWNIIQP